MSSQKTANMVVINLSHTRDSEIYFDNDFLLIPKFANTNVPSIVSDADTKKSRQQR